MAQGTSKVWVISPTKAEKNRTPSEQIKYRPTTDKQTPRRTAPATRAARRWRDILLAYLIGPVTLALWLKGRSRWVWSAVGCGSVVAGIAMMAFGSSLTRWLEASPNGVSIWLIAVPAVTLLIAVSWARAIAAVTCGRATMGSRFPAWMRRSGPVAAIGTLVPGLGLQIAGYTKRGAWVFAIVGPIASAVIVLLHWRWLWERSRSAVPPGVSGNALEAAFIAAAGIGVATLLVWIVQALDGARLVSTSRTRARANAASVILLLSLAFFFTTFRPVSFAGSLGTTAAALRHDGLRVIPLGLCEAAMRLDPASPVYIAQAAELNEAMGMADAAQAKRQIIERRARAYLEIVGGRGALGHATPATSSATIRALDSEDHITMGTARVWRSVVTPHR